MKKKLFTLLLTTAMASSLLAGCGGNQTKTDEPAASPSAAPSASAEAEKDTSSLAGTTISVYTHGGNRVLGEEKKDDAGNTYRDESTAILKHLAEKFTQETGINVELNVITNESEIEPLFKVEDDSVDVFTAPNWSLEQWAAYTEPYCTVEEAVELYGDYAYAMPNDEKNIFSIMPGKAYNQAVVYNEEVLKSVGYDAIPATQAEFEEMCEKIRAAGITPISIHRVENWPLATLNDFAAYVSGVPNAFESMLKSDTPFSETEPVGKTIKMYTEWKAKGFFEPEVYTDFGVAMDSVAYGKAAMMLFGSWVVPQIQGRVPAGTDPSIIKFAPAPDFGSGRYVLAAPADNWAISKFSKNKEAARAFIEYVSEDAQFIADSGYIANKKGVTPVVPELYSIIDQMVESGEAIAMMQPAQTQNTINNQNVLTEANLWADYKYAGLLFDALDVTKPDDWTAYNKQVEAQNKAYVEYRDELGVSWQE
ncbi:extracellular solute-binding protein [Cellulosilyticum sp. ST5]|uniref:ABC transporter substrate-binding protein n=1 Tax=unclassified Cellulosilyticum TaxID=2643091 RepID=UPI000F8D9AC2|nr:extracellular solute-binding protein [Cellulosilyticum sp. WCF-2]QEH70644.1 extracellular solute-binding protein [Cellulosilyticum sp. WCF-2]